MDENPERTKAVRHIGFSQMDWTRSGPGARSKQTALDGRRMRILEITPELVHPEWCRKGHAGYVLEGALELRFEDEVRQYEAGEAFIVPSGENGKHIPRALTPRATLLLFEDDV